MGGAIQHPPSSRLSWLPWKQDPGQVSWCHPSNGSRWGVGGGGTGHACSPRRGGRSNPGPPPATRPWSPRYRPDPHGLFPGRGAGTPHPSPGNPSPFAPAQRRSTDGRVGGPPISAHGGSPLSPVLGGGDRHRMGLRTLPLHLVLSGRGFRAGLPPLPPTPRLLWKLPGPSPMQGAQRRGPCTGEGLRWGAGLGCQSGLRGPHGGGGGRAEAGDTSLTGRGISCFVSSAGYWEEVPGGGGGRDAGDSCVCGGGSPCTPALQRPATRPRSRAPSTAPGGREGVRPPPTQVPAQGAAPPQSWLHLQSGSCWGPQWLLLVKHSGEGASGPPHSPSPPQHLLHPLRGSY